MLGEWEVSSGPVDYTRLQPHCFLWISHVVAIWIQGRLSTIRDTELLSYQIFLLHKHHQRHIWKVRDFNFNHILYNKNNDFNAAKLLVIRDLVPRGQEWSVEQNCGHSSSNLMFWINESICFRQHHPLFSWRTIVPCALILKRLGLAKVNEAGRSNKWLQATINM